MKVNKGLIDHPKAPSIEANAKKKLEEKNSNSEKKTSYAKIVSYILAPHVAGGVMYVIGDFFSKKMDCFEYLNHFYNRAIEVQTGLFSPEKTLQDPPEEVNMIPTISAVLVLGVIVFQLHKFLSAKSPEVLRGSLDPSYAFSLWSEEQPPGKLPIGIRTPIEWNEQGHPSLKVSDFQLNKYV